MPCGYANIAVLHIKIPCPLFSLPVRGTKRKADKREMPCMGRCPKPRQLLKKLDQNFHTSGECKLPDKSKFQKFA